jgi:hypothetical protein
MEKTLTTTLKNMAFLSILFLYGGVVCKSSAHRRSKALKSIHTYIEWNHGAKLSQENVKKIAQI